MLLTIEADELHIISTLVNVSLFVRYDVGAPQGDCANAIKFTYYLTETLDPVKSN